MLKKILLQVFNYDGKIFNWLEGRSSTNIKIESGGERSPLKGPVESSASISTPSNKNKIHPFPDPWDGDWNDAVINWAYWTSYEDKQRESKGKESPEMGSTNVNRDT